MKEGYKVQFMIRISDELHERIKQDAIDQDRSQSYIARRILEDNYDVSSKKETYNAYEKELKKLSAPTKRKRKPVTKTKKG